MTVNLVASLPVPARGRDGDDGNARDIVLLRRLVVAHAPAKRAEDRHGLGCIDRRTAPEADQAVVVAAAQHRPRRPRPRYRWARGTVLTEDARRQFPAARRGARQRSTRPDDTMKGIGHHQSGRVRLNFSSTPAISATQPPPICRMRGATSVVAMTMLSPVTGRRHYTADTRRCSPSPLKAPGLRSSPSGNDRRGAVQQRGGRGLAPGRREDAPWQLIRRWRRRASIPWIICAWSITWRRSSAAACPLERFRLAGRPSEFVAAPRRGRPAGPAGGVRAAGHRWRRPRADAPAQARRAGKDASWPALRQAVSASRTPLRNYIAGTCIDLVSAGRA